MDVVTQEPTSSEICSEISTQLEENEIGTQEESAAAQQQALLELVMELAVTYEEQDSSDERTHEL